VSLLRERIRYSQMRSPARSGKSPAMEGCLDQGAPRPTGPPSPEGLWAQGVPGTSILRSAKARLTEGRQIVRDEDQSMIRIYLQIATKRQYIGCLSCE
jgi:hypothetical protein